MSSYARPLSLDEALELLAADGAVPLGGGTDLAGQADRGIRQPAALVDLRDAGLATVEADGDGVRIGAAVTLAELRESLMRAELERHGLRLVGLRPGVGGRTVADQRGRRLGSVRAAVGRSRGLVLGRLPAALCAVAAEAVRERSVLGVAVGIALRRVPDLRIAVAYRRIELVAEVVKLTSTAQAAVTEKEAPQPAPPATAPADAKTYPLPDPEPGTEPGGN